MCLRFQVSKATLPALLTPIGVMNEIPCKIYEEA